MTRGLLRVSSVCTAVLLLMLAHPAWSAVTGKVAGVVTDGETGEPLVGAAVSIVGARIGATTDSDGRYFIIGVAAGSYSLQAAMIGYQSLTKEGVRVNIDRTVAVDFSVAPSAIAVEGVTVTAQREVIKLDVSGSSTIMQPADVIAVPRKSLQEALALQPGVGVNGEIRGGTLGQTQMIVDGRLAVDERLNRPVMTVSTSALEEVQVLTGGFNAEYGNARSGIVNVVTRGAINRPIWVTFDAQYFPAHTKFREPGGYDAFGAGSIEWQTYGNDNTSTMLISTKLDPEDVNVTLPDTLHVGWDNYPDAQNPLGLSATQLRDKWRHQHPAWDYGADGDADYVVDAAVGIPVSDMFGLVLSGRREYTAYATPQYEPAYVENLYNAKVNVRPMEAMRLDITANYGTVVGLGTARSGYGLEGVSHTIYRDFGASINFLNPTTKYGQYGIPSANNSRYAVAVNMAYSLGDDRLLELGLDYSAFDYNVGPSDRQVNFNAGEEGVVVFQGSAGADTVSSIPYGFTGESFYDGTSLGYDLNGSDSEMDSSDYTAVRVYGSFTNQIGARNLVKIGFDGTFNSFNNFGGHVGPKDEVYQQWNATPSRMALYVQDKIEYEGMIANVGLRLDMFNSNGEVIERVDQFSDIFDENAWGNRAVDWDPAKSIRERYGPNGSVAVDSAQFEDAEAKVTLSPRLGVSHPISQTTKVFFNYGHFYNVPESQWLYGNVWNQPGSINHSGNADIEMPRTISYELGFDQELMGQYLIRANIFYKDETNEIKRMGFTSSGPQKYTRWIPYNKQYSDTRGLEFSVAKRVGSFATGFINGGVQTKNSTYLGPMEVFSQLDGFAGNRPYEEVQPTAARAQPYGKLSIDLHTPMDLAAFGMPAMATGGWSLNWLTEYRRGGEGTYDPVGNYVFSPNIENPDWWMSDVRITKSFAISGYDLALYMDVLNVLDRKIWSGGMRAVDYTEYLRSLHFPIDDPLIEDTPGDDKIGDTPSYAQLPEQDQWALWKYPRTIAFGLRMSF